MAERIVQILIADDSTDDAAFLMQAFREASRLPISFTHVTDGEVASVTLGSDQRFDLALLDYYLPKRTAQEIAQRLQDDQRVPAYPVVVLTSYIPPVKIHELTDLGFDRVMQKPVDWVGFQALVELLLRMTDN